ncbi:MAG: sulfurtransferase TusA family protein [Candidatus Bathyarchaeia archaeon]|nr:sulfurtransferase TusA family protein [Candidatus Bathyarchaeota archaeon]
MNEVITVDARYKSCPGPLIAISEAVKNAKPKQIIKLLATDPAAPFDIKAWSESVGHKLLKASKRNGIYEIEIEVR